MGKPVGDKGKVKIRATEYVCPECECREEDVCRAAALSTSAGNEYYFKPEGLSLQVERQKGKWDTIIVERFNIISTMPKHAPPGTYPRHLNYEVSWGDFSSLTEDEREKYAENIEEAIWDWWSDTGRNIDSGKTAAIVPILRNLKVGDEIVIEKYGAQTKNP